MNTNERTMPHSYSLLSVRGMSAYAWGGESLRIADVLLAVGTPSVEGEEVQTSELGF